jgi:hypothetical protein
MVFIGSFQRAKRVGKITGRSYIFEKDKFGMPIQLEVDEEDARILVEERGSGCATHAPDIIFMTLMRWNIELQNQRNINRRV